MHDSKPYETEDYKYLGDYIFYLKPNFVDTETYRPNGALQADKYYFSDETERVDGNGPFDTEAQCREAFLDYCKSL